MKDRFKIGDRVRIVCPASDCAGDVTTITGIHPTNPHSARLRPDVFVAGEPIYALETLPHWGDIPAGDVFALPGRFLAPIYDGDEKVSWSSCVWQPETIQAGM